MKQDELLRTLDLEEQEQIAALRAWWQRWGNLILTVVTVVLLAIAGYNAWQWYGRSQAAEASALYDTLQKAAAEKNMKAVRDSAGAILEQFPRTAFAPMAALVAGKAHFDAGDLKSARAQLQWVIDNAKEADLKSIARLRLANVLVDDDAPDEALKLLDAPATGEFVAQFGSLRGDILVLKGQSAEARAAYKAALEKVDEKSSGLKDRLQSKLDALGDG